MRRPVRRVRPNVAIVARSVPHYRAPFYNGLRDTLAGRGVELTVVYGTGSGTFSERRDKVELPWATPVPSRAARIGKGRLVWQPALRYVRGADLVVVPQQTQLLFNYPLLARQLTGRQRIAFWGHGRNFQQWRASAGGEKLKRWMSQRVHWWFAYNELSAQAVTELGFPSDRITVVNNAIDTRGLRTARARLDDTQLEAVRDQFGVDPGRHGQVAVYAGGLYADKRLDVLVAAAERIRQRVDGFELIVIGAGSHQGIVEAAAARHPWFHYVGPQFGADKVRFFALSKLLLMPGLVGLAVLDAFALETPIITLADSPHSPEIEYLNRGENGIVVDPVGAGADPVEAYSRAVVDLLRDEGARRRLVEGCRRARHTFSIEEMVRRYADGIEAALDAPNRRGGDMRRDGLNQQRATTLRHGD